MRYLILLTTTLFTLATLAQTTNTHNISGTIVEKGTSKPIAGATIQLFRADSLVKGTFANAEGFFSMENVPAISDMILVISSLGFEILELPVEWKKATNLALGKIAMKDKVNALENVVVTGQRKAFEMKMDRRVFNPDQQLTAKGGTAVDVLKNIPSVSVDAQGGVELRGSSPQIFIDGRPTILTLEQIAADDIDRVEVITNPSSKYDAATSGGIINVVLKKNKARGVNGNISAGIGYPDIRTGYVGVNVRQRKLNFFITGNYNQSGGRARGETDRTNLENGIPSGGFQQVSFNDRLRKNGNGRIGVDYFIDNYNTITVSQGITGGEGRSIGKQAQTFYGPDRSVTGTGDRDEFYNWAW
ncbi:MAG TPA: carboxypeptidase-like regulatory domain-containing protein, partial [Phnomibacter sp.]|nr:carboxypeptidase-like regulatory domain-containing protein [Phnomibacter sp.]